MFLVQSEACPFMAGAAHRNDTTSQRRETGCCRTVPDVLQAAEAEVKAAQEHAALFQATVLAGPDVGPAFHHMLEIVAGLYPEQVGGPTCKWFCVRMAGSMPG